MPLWDERDAGRTAPTGVLAIIERLLSTGAVTSVHYFGYAHESVLRLLHRHLGTAFTVTDYPDRYSTGAEFFWEGEGECPGPGRPDWLEGVAFYQEGIPDADLLIFDVPWSAPDQLSAILERHRPKHLLLADEACSGASHPDYSWAVFPRYAHGTLNSDNR